MLRTSMERSKVYKEQKTINLFPIQLYKEQVPDNERLKELLIPKIEKYKSETVTPPKWFTNKYTGSYYSEDVNNQVNEKVFNEPEVNRQYEKVMSNIFSNNIRQRKPFYNTVTNGCWFNYYSEGEYQERHNHVGSHFAIIHFLQYDPFIHSPITFIDPIGDLKQYFIDFNSDNHYSFYKNIDLKVKEGDFIMFPAYLDHEVKPSKPTPNLPRITVSMNLQFNE